jgi:hypothetical protein
MVPWKTLPSLLLIAAISLAVAGPAAAAGDPYLQGLREEAGKLERLGQAKKEIEQLEKQGGGQSQKKAAPSVAPLSPAEVTLFENGLKQYPAGYGLYNQLDAKQQRIVFLEYAQTTGHSGIRYLAAIKLIILMSTGAP